MKTHNNTSSYCNWFLLVLFSGWYEFNCTVGDTVLLPPILFLCMCSCADAEGYNDTGREIFEEEQEEPAEAPSSSSSTSKGGMFRLARCVLECWRAARCRGMPRVTNVCFQCTSDCAACVFCVGMVHCRVWLSSVY